MNENYPLAHIDFLKKRMAMKSVNPLSLGFFLIVCGSPSWIKYH